MIPTHGQMGRVLVEVVGGAPHDVQVAAGPRDPIVGRARAPVPNEKKNIFVLLNICSFSINLTISASGLINVGGCGMRVVSPI